jgi:L-fuconolactonase
MKIDSHQHFWKYNEKEFGWINDKMGVLKRDWLPGDLQTELINSGFDGSIAVQARQTTEETRWLLQLAEADQVIKGVVGWVDLCSNRAKEYLEEYSSSSKLVGIRHVIQDEPDDDFILRKDFTYGISHLKEFNLAYDILIFPGHLRNTVSMVKQFPDQVFILDHIAKPDIKGKIVSPWKEDIRVLSRYENVYCKLSGMVTESDWKDHSDNDFRIYLDIVTEAFGPDRLMIGSDWPVCRLAASYTNTINIVKNYISGFSESEQNQILGLTAVKAYGLNGEMK